MWKTWRDVSEQNIKQMTGSWLAALILKYRNTELNEGANSEDKKWCDDLIRSCGMLSKIAYVG